MSTVHNPDRCMVDLRRVLSQGKKRIGLFVGAGAGVSVRVNEDGQMAESGQPLIPDVEGLTTSVLDALEHADRHVVDHLVKKQLGGKPNVEAILTKVRQLADAIGDSPVYGFADQDFNRLAEAMCGHIGKRVQAALPEGESPYLDLVSWITGTRRGHPVEVFTPNYDLLIEEALERQQAQCFDGFVGSHRPFFDSASVLTDTLPSRWTLLWKLHGSLCWEEAEGQHIVRTGKREATALIYPEHRKYTQVGRLPYSALFERLRSFLTEPDTLLLCTGFSFSDVRRQLDLLRSRLLDRRFDFLLHPGPWEPDLAGKTSADLDKLLGGWLGSDQPVTILDLSGVPSTILERLVGAILKIVYEALFWSREKTEGGVERPLLVVMEEAHRYLGAQSKGLASEMAQRIAKEGRKYGVGAMVISQRPSEVDETVLSQCGTFFALRLSNPDDRARVRGTLPDGLTGLLDVLPVLRTGEAVVTGEAAKLPMRRRVELPAEEYRPRSEDPAVTEQWASKRRAEGYERVVASWRAQSPRAVVENLDIERVVVSELRATEELSITVPDSENKEEP